MRAYICPGLRGLLWVPAGFWAQFKVIVPTFTILYSLCPAFLKDHLLSAEMLVPLKSSRRATFMFCHPLKFVWRLLQRDPFCPLESFERSARQPCSCGLLAPEFIVAGHLKCATGCFAQFGICAGLCFVYVYLSVSELDSKF